MGDNNWISSPTAAKGLRVSKDQFIFEEALAL